MLRLVPPDPDPQEFPYREFACNLRPVRCDQCTAPCPHGMELFQPKEEDETPVVPI